MAGALGLRRLRVHGPSMSPALRAGDTVIVALGVPGKPGDVGLVRWAQRPGVLSVKRLHHPEAGGWFVLGDNEFASTDSRELGAAEVLGVILVRLWPRPGRVRRPFQVR